MKNNLNNFIKSAKAEKLSENEKGILRARILEFISFNPIRGKTPLLRERNYISIFEVRAFAKAGALLLIIAVVAGGSGVSYAAQNSLPGDSLYGIKVNVNEAIEEGLARTPTARAAVQSKKVERRLEEAQSLAKAGQLSTVNQKIVIDQIEEHIKDLENEIETLRKDGEVEVVLETTAKLTPVLEAHKEILEKNAVNDEVGDNDGTENLIAKVEDGIKTVESEENATIADVSADAEEPQTDTLTLAKAENIQKDMKRNAEETIDEISGEIEDLVKSRIESAREKIRSIEEKQTEIDAKLKLITPINTETIIEESKTESVLLESITTVVSEVSKTETKESLNPEPATLEEKTIVTGDDFNIESRIKLANDLIKEANRLSNEGEWPEALELAQEVNRIASEIDTHIHLKEMDLSKANSTGVENKASAVDGIK